MKNGGLWWTVCFPALTKDKCPLDVNHNCISGSQNCLAKLREANVPPECLKIRVDNDFHDGAV